MDANIIRSSFKPLAVVATIAAVVALTAFTGIGQANAADPGDPDFLGTAETFVIIAANTVTDAGPVMGTEVHGDVGSTSTAPNAVELDPLQVINGAIYVDNPTPDPVAMQALADAKIAYGLVAAAAPTEIVGTANLALNSNHLVSGVYVYTPGVYRSASDLLLNGDITLDGLNNADSVFIFQALTQALTVGSGSHVILINGAQACNVYWQVGSSATIGTNAEFVGTVLAATSITLDTNATVDGQLLSSNLNAGAVVLDDNVINGQTLCVRTTTTGTTATGTTTTTTTRVDGATTTTTSSTPPVAPTTGPGNSTLPNTGNTGNTTLARTGNSTLANTGSPAPTGTESGAVAALLALALGGFLIITARRSASTDA
jgi:type VI secretion system secreted protein VgrG